MTMRTWTVAKREIKEYIDRPAAYILLTVFAAIIYFFFFRAAFLSGESSLRPLFEILPWIFLLLIPAITMRLMAEEERTGTIEVLVTQPVREMDVLAGKFLGALFFVKIALAITLTMPLSLMLAGGLDWGVVIAQYFGAVLLAGLFISTGLFASSVTKNQVVASIIAAAINFALIIIGFELVVLSVPPSVLGVIQAMSALTHFQNLTRGVIDLRDVLYFVSMIVAFGALSFWLLKRRKMNRTSALYKNLQIGTAVLIGIVIVVNLMGDYVPGRIDLTSQRLYTLSPATVKILRGLPDVVSLKLFASQELPPQVALTYRDLKDTLQDYAGSSGGKVQLSYQFPDTDEKAAQQAQALGIPPVEFNVISKEQFQLKRGYLGVAITYAGKRESIPFVQSTNDLEYQLTSLIRKLTATEKKTVGFLSGHGEKSLFQDMPAVEKELSKTYDVKDIAATGKKKGLDLKDVSTLIVAGPSQAMPKKQQTSIADFLAGGGSVLFLIKQYDVNPQYMQATPNDNSLADFVEAYGLRVNRDIVYDVRSNEQVTFSGGQLSYTLPYPFWARVAVRPGIAGDVKTAVLPWASSIEPVKDRLSGEKVTQLLRTSRFASAETSDFNIAPNREFKPDPAKMSSQLVGASVEGRNLPSGDSTGAASGGKTRAAKAYRMAVIGNVDFLTDQFAKQAPENVALGLNIVDWLTREEALSSIRAKNADPRKLLFGSEGAREAVRWGNEIGVPVLIVIVGAWHLIRRRNRSRGVVAQ